MSKKGEEFKDIMTKVLLADPITVKGRDALTSIGINISEDEYLSKVYVEPFTLFRRDFSEQPDACSDPDMEIGYAKTVRLNTLNDIKSTFENRLKNLTDSLFVVKGGAGSGKTTYVHHLQNELQETKFFFCDFELADKAISLFENEYDFQQKFNSNIWKFVSILATQIAKILLYNEIKNCFDSHQEYINAIVKIYETYFNILEGDITVVDEEFIRSFFECMKEYAMGKQIYSDFCKVLYQHTRKQFDYFEDADQRKEAVEYMCGILIRLFFCLNHICCQKKGSMVRFVCVIDNIEYFVPFDEVHPIQECELQTILNGVSDSTSRIKPTITKWKQLLMNYNPFFGFLLVTRDTSVSLAEYRQYDDYMKENEIDITKWFWVDEIYQKKEKHFRQAINMLKDNAFYIAYRNITGDISQYNWGMHNVICQMYNYNYRRIGLDVVNAVASQPDNVVEDFNKMWDVCINKAELGAIKHMCRKYVFRILLDYIQQTNYFDFLLVEKESASSRKNITEDDRDKSSYARKIATVLSRISLIEPNVFMSFPKLVEAILKPPFLSKKLGSEIEDLASILYLMNETRNNQTNWAPLIMIKFDSEQVYNKDNLANELRKQWGWHTSGDTRNYSQVLKYGVRITEAGKFFAKMVPDFEYFACRYAPEFPALFVKENLKLKPNGNYQCLELIKIVRENAFQCINEVINRDYNFFSSTGQADAEKYRFSMLYDDRALYKWMYQSKRDETKIPHPLRILNHQQGYLSHYLEYVSYLPEDTLDINAKQKIIEGVQAEIGEYRNKMHSLQENYASYLNL